LKRVFAGDLEVLDAVEDASGQNTPPIRKSWMRFTLHGHDLSIFSRRAELDDRFHVVGMKGRVLANSSGRHAFGLSCQATVASK